MKAHLQTFAFLLLGILSGQFLFAQATYRESEPPGMQTSLEENITAFSIDAARESGSKLLISSRSEVTVFVNDQLIYHVTNDTIPVENLGEGFLQVKLFCQDKPTVKLLRVDSSVKAVGLPVVRESRGFTNFLSVYLSIVLSFLALLKVLRGRDLVEMFRVDTMFSPRNKDENILRNKIISTGNVLFFAFFALLVSGIVVILTYMLQKEAGAFSFFFSRWLLWLLYVSVFILLKFLIISFFVYLFKIKHFLVFHLINYLRISLFFASLWLMVIVFINWFDGGETMILWVVSSLFVSMLFRTAIIFFKLINEAKHRLFHLFSYLCGTEILPLFWLILLASYLF